MNEEFEQQDQTAARSVSFENVLTHCEEYMSYCLDESPGKPRPAIKDYLEEVTPHARPALLRNLLQIEIDRRLGEGEKPTPDEYVNWFPEHASLIRQAFAMTTDGEHESQERTRTDPTSQDDRPAARFIGDYELIRELGKGGMGLVYEACHLKLGSHVALKTLPHVEADGLHRFKREFRTLADVNHPNIIGLHTLESDGCHWFFTMDLIDGVDLMEYVRPGQQLDEQRLKSTFAQLVNALSALHRRGIIHRDIKPANIMVNDEGHVTLLDFGLVVESTERNVSQTGRFAGTPLYMAPEQAAGEIATPATDWYALGVMIYEAITGQTPFNGSYLKIVQDKQRLDPPELGCSDGSDDLRAICMQLLARDPRERPGIDAISEVISEVTVSDKVAAQPIVHSEQLIGREDQKRELQEAYESFQQSRKPLTVFVSGRSGEGKTALSEQFLAPFFSKKDLVVLSGRCYDRESVPFKALDRLIDSLTNYLMSLPETAAFRLMPVDIAVLSQVFPVMKRVEAVNNAPRGRISQLDEQQVRKRAFTALRELLWMIGDKTPIVMFIDDIQWGDADSAKVMLEVLRPPDAPSVFFIGSYRSDEADGSAFLEEWDSLKRKEDIEIAQRDIRVGPLSLEQCYELLQTEHDLDVDIARTQAERLVEETGGNPFFLTQLIASSVMTSDSVQNLTLQTLIHRKLEGLPMDAAELLEIVAVSGQALTLSEASDALGMNSPAIATTTHMRSENLIRLVGNEADQLIDTYHDKVRETVLGNLTDSVCRARHRSLAETIEHGAGLDVETVADSLDRSASSESSEPEAIARVYDLAYHFDAAGDTRKAWVYGLVAAEQARSQFALEVASEQYAIAERNSSAVDNDIRHRIAAGQGETLMLLGKYGEASGVLRNAIDLIDDKVRTAKIEIILAETEYKRGEMDRSFEIFESALAKLGNRVPSSVMSYGWSIVRECFIRVVHNLRPQQRHRVKPTEKAKLELRGLCGICHPFFFQSTHKVFWSTLAGVNRADQYPKTTNLAQTYSHFGMLLSMLGFHSWGAYYSDASLAVSIELEDLGAQGNSYCYMGVGDTATARYAEGIERSTRASEAFEKTGDLWQANVARFHRACCHFGLGDLDKAIEDARATFQSSSRANDSRTLCSSYVWARATGGNILFEKLRESFPNRPDDVVSSVHGVMAEGQWHAFHGRTKESLECFEDALSRIWQRLCINSHTIHVVPMLASALRVHADAVETSDIQKCKQLRKRALRVARWAVRFARIFRAAYPLSCRELSRIYASLGKPRKALKYADKSCSIAEKQKAIYEHAQSLLLRGQLAQQLGRPEGEQQIETAQGELEKFSIMIEEASTIA